MSNERARQKRLERKRRKREERRRAARAAGTITLELGPPMSAILPHFAEPWLDRLPEDVDLETMRHVLQLAAFVWNFTIVGEPLDEPTLAAGRELFQVLGWREPFEEEARVLRRRKAVLYPEEERVFVGIEVARESGGLRVYAASAVAA